MRRIEHITTQVTGWAMLIGLIGMAFAGMPVGSILAGAVGLMLIAGFMMIVYALTQ
jgi:hypothetical protein